MKKARIFLVAICFMVCVTGVFATKHQFANSKKPDPQSNSKKPDPQYYTMQNIYYRNLGAYHENGFGWYSPTLVYYTSGAPISGQATISIMGNGPFGLYSYAFGSFYPVY
jgi:hypothetical protein